MREAILSGETAPGARLNEVRLSQMLEVSRTPVRAALQVLAGEGLLDYQPNRGYVVRQFPLSEIVDAYDIRAQLEGLATRFAAERGFSDEERAIIEQSLRDGDALFDKGHFADGDLARYRRHQRQFSRDDFRRGQEPDAQRNDPDLPSRAGVVEPQHHRL